MSYAGPAANRTSKRSTATRSARAAHSPATDWQQVAVFGAGLALGIALGAGVALLTAAQDGEETRSDLQRQARRTSRMLGHRSKNAWIELRDELRRAARSLRRAKPAEADIPQPTEPV